MIPQISKREIGCVTIVDIKGELSGPWAIKSEELIKQMVGKGDHKLVFNLQGMTNLDSLGAKSLFSATPDGEIGILFASPMIMDAIGQFSHSKRFRSFLNEEELVSVYGEALTSHKTEEGTELRSASRLQTALPVELSYQEEDEKVEFRAIVTNLSESGLFAEYIDLKAADWSLEHMSPYDLKVLDVKLILPKRKIAFLKGKVVHRRLDGHQVGIGIQLVDIQSKERDLISEFLKFMTFKTNKE